MASSASDARLRTATRPLDSSRPYPACTCGPSQRAAPPSAQAGIPPPGLGRRRQARRLRGVHHHPATGRLPDSLVGWECWRWVDGRRTCSNMMRPPCGSACPPGMRDRPAKPHGRFVVVSAGPGILRAAVRAGGGLSAPLRVTAQSPASNASPRSLRAAVNRRNRPLRQRAEAALEAGRSRPTQRHRHRPATPRRRPEGIASHSVWLPVVRSSRRLQAAKRTWGRRRWPGGGAL